MKRLIMLLAVCFSASIASAQPSFVVTVDAFDERLSPYGSWLELEGMGRVWQPAMEYVGDDFYPYGTGGHWVLTDEGWVFDSDYPFGWAVFHYGRWLDDPDYGWVWVPGSAWAPAWVSWRTGGSYVGWAPMGPRGVPVMRHDRWLFVETNQLTVVNVRSRAVDERRFHDAVAITSPMHGARSIGPPAAYVTAATRVEVRAVPMNQVHDGRSIPPPPPPGQVRPPPAQRRDAPFRSPPPARDAVRAPPPPPPARDAPVRALPPPPPGASMDDRRPPPPRADLPRIEPDRRNAPPPPRADPPPPRNEPDRRLLPPPPPREQPDRRFMPPPAPGHVDRNPGFAPQPGAYAPPRPPPPSAAPGQPPPAPTKPRVQPGPPPPPGRRSR